MTPDEQKILEAYRQCGQQDRDFVLVIEHETLDTGGSVVLIKKAHPTRIYEVSKPLYDFVQNIPKKPNGAPLLFLLNITENMVQIFDVRPEN